MKNLIYCGMLIVLYLVLFADSSISGISTTSNVIVKHCMEDGGYCQNSWDCCSNRCLSFSYKCVKGPPSAGYKPFVPVEGPTLISVDSVDDLINRFGGDDDDKTPAMSTTTSSTSTSTSISSSAIQSNSQCIGIGYECADSTQCCSSDCLHYMNINICIEKRTTTTTAPTNGQCLQVGQKCYRHEECCTLRCHGFLHQCVT